MVSGLLPSRCLTETSTGRIPRTCYTKPVEGEVRGCLTSTLLLCSPSIRAILSISIHIYTHWLQLQLCHQRLFRHALASDTASTALFLHLFSFSPFNKVTHLLTNCSHRVITSYSELKCPCGTFLVPGSSKRVVRLPRHTGMKLDWTKLDVMLNCA